MGLSNDQRAMLQLLLEGDQGYGDLAALLGVTETEVRGRAQAIFVALGAPDLDRDAPLTDFLLGQADSGQEAAARAHLGTDPEAHATAKRLHAQLRLLFPAAQLPDLSGTPAATASPAAAATPATPPAAEPSAPEPAAPATPPAAAAPAAQSAPSSPEPAPPAPHAPPTPKPTPPTAAPTQSTAPQQPPADSAASTSTPPIPPSSEATGLTGQQKRLMAALVGTGMVVIAIVLGVTGVFGGGDGDSGAATADTTAAASTEADVNSEMTGATLSARDGSKARGEAVFGTVEGVPVLQVTAEDLKPTAQGEEYSIWLYRDDEYLLRLAGFKVDKTGQIASQLELPEAALAYIADGTINKIDFGDKGFTSLVFFGAPVATENAEAAAVSFAQGLKTAGLDKIEGVTYSAGIDAGLVYSGLLGGERRNEWTCIGDAVNTSARLMTAADPGQTLTSSRISKASEKRWEFQDKGTRILKGKANEEQVFQPSGVRGRVRGFVYRNPMLGRDKELNELTEFVAPVYADDTKFPGVLRLLGEPGLGKTRLVAALRKTGRTRNALPLDHHALRRRAPQRLERSQHLAAQLFRNCRKREPGRQAQGHRGALRRVREQREDSRSHPQRTQAHHEFRRRPGGLPLG